MNPLQRDIESFLKTGEGDFERLALELFSYQFDKNAPYQAWCKSQDIAPSQIRHWQDIPAVPIGAFKSAEFVTFPKGQAAAVFESSGTTSAMRSRHYLRTLSYYEAALCTAFAKDILPDGMKMPFLMLTPSPAEAPRSSLSWMMDVLKRTYGAPGSAYLVQRGRLDELGLSTLLSKLTAENKPAALLGTTVAFLAFFDDAVKSGKSWTLAPGSRIMSTGGMKTSKREISRSEFVRWASEILGVPESSCFNEYGMCELGSQFYGRGNSRDLTGPPWTRTLVIDPLSGEPAAVGQEGLLRHFDLANVDSVMAIQTEDIGRLTPDGFTLLGRDPNAEVKGCSLAAEAFLA